MTNLPHEQSQHSLLGMEPVFGLLEDFVGVCLKDGIGDFQSSPGGETVEHQTAGGGFFQQLVIDLIGAGEHVGAGFLLGFLLAAYLNVPVLGIALLGVIIVALMLVNDQNKPNNTVVVDGGADDDF